MSFTESPNLKNFVSGKQKACNMKLTRTFHPVGQGAFYTERFYKGDKNIFNMVYDCGSKTKGIGINQIIDDVFQPDDEINLLFVSHFHEDHINGIEYLANNHKIKKLVIPSLSTIGANLILVDYLYNLHSTSDLNNYANRFIESCYDQEMRFEQSNGVEIIQIGDKASQIPVHDTLWEYHPSCAATEHQDFVSELIDAIGFQECYDIFNGRNFAVIRDYFEKDGNIDKLHNFYKSYFEEKHRDDNFYSMTVLSKPADNDFKQPMCLYTGDFPARYSCCRKKLTSDYKQYWDDINILQSPHHGSGRDNHVKIHDVKKRNCVISYGKDNQYRHPHKNALIIMINAESTIHLVNEDQGSKYQTDYIF